MLWDKTTVTCWPLDLNTKKTQNVMAVSCKVSHPMTTHQQFVSALLWFLWVCTPGLFTVNITYVKLEEQISLFGGNFIICTKCQVMDLRAFSQVHALSPKDKQTWFKLCQMKHERISNDLWLIIVHDLAFLIFCILLMSCELMKLFLGGQT